MPDVICLDALDRLALPLPRAPADLAMPKEARAEDRVPAQSKADDGVPEQPRAGDT